MKEMQAVVDAIAAARNADRPLILATLIGFEGSSYRLPGARMLLMGEGDRIGSISGGCLENEIWRRGQSLTPQSPPLVVSYSTMGQDDALWGHGSGCKGILKILLECIDPRREPHHIRFVRDCLQNPEGGILATVCSLEGEMDLTPGTRLMLRSDGFATAGAWPMDLASAVRQEARAALRGGRSYTKVFTTSRGRAEIFLEVIRRCLHLYILGAGNAAVPLVRLAKELGWYITVWDRRPALADPRRFPGADAVIACPLGEAHQRLGMDDHSAAVIMTHNYHEDLDLLRTLVPSSLRYIGILGSRDRTQQLLSSLVQEGLKITPDHLQRVFGPVGLDIGADTPEEIALSIVAEIKASLSGRMGGFLRDRQMPIHDRSVPASNPEPAIERLNPLTHEPKPRE
ncbi:MAG: XdhC family protein [Bacillota bacterium]